MAACFCGCGARTHHMQPGNRPPRSYVDTSLPLPQDYHQSTFRTDGTLYILAVSTAPAAQTPAMSSPTQFTSTLSLLGRTHFQDVKTYLLLDSHATRENIETVLARDAQEAKPGDTFVFYFDGRSLPRAVSSQRVSPLAASRAGRSVSQDYCLLPYGIAASDGQAVATQALGAARLKIWLSKIRARQQWIVLARPDDKANLRLFVRRLTEQNPLLQSLLRRTLVVTAPAGRRQVTLPAYDPVLTSALVGMFSREEKSQEATNDWPHYTYLQDVLAHTSQEVARVTGQQVTIMNAQAGNEHIAIAGVEQIDAKESSGAKASTGASWNPNRCSNYAVLFATDTYREWPALSNPISDAEALADVLEKKYGFEALVVRNPTKRDILATLSKYYDRTYDRTSELVVVFAGHGAATTSPPEGYIIASDTKADDPFHDTDLWYSQLRTVVDGIPCGHLMLMVDVCYGGTFDRKVAKAAAAPAPVAKMASALRGRPELDKASIVRPRPLVPIGRGSSLVATGRGTKLVSAPSASKGGDRNNDVYAEVPLQERIERLIGDGPIRQFLSSGTDTSVPDGVPGQHSPFTLQISKALQTGGPDGIVTAHDLLRSAQRTLATPHFEDLGNGSAGEFVFVSKDAIAADRDGQ